MHNRLDRAALQTTLDEIRHANSGGNAVNDNLRGKSNAEITNAGNALLASLEPEISYLCQELTALFGKKFPELASIHLKPIDYVRTVKEIGNSLDVTKVGLSKILPNSLVLIVTMSAAQSNSKPLSIEELDRCNALCDDILSLFQAQSDILAFIEGQMIAIAPNLSQLVGTKIAAQLVGAAHGIEGLSKIPGGNIQVIGSHQKELSGFSTISVRKHEGFISQCDYIQDLPADLQKKAQRLIASKCALAARVDASRAQPEGNYGLQLYEEIQKMLTKWEEPSQLRREKPLPAPKEYAKQRRGGKRVRRIKELTDMTEVRRLQNRLAFGVSPESEIGTGESTRGLGLLYASERGPLRVQENTKIKEALIRKSQKTYSKYSVL